MSGIAPDSVHSPTADELGKWSGLKNSYNAKINSYSPGSADYLVRKSSPVRIRAWPPSPCRGSVLPPDARRVCGKVAINWFSKADRLHTRRPLGWMDNGPGGRGPTADARNFATCLCGLWR